MNRNFFLVLLILCSSIYMFAQISAEELINNEDKYIWGKGTGSTLEEADLLAMKNLNESISCEIKSSFVEQVDELRKKTGNQEVITLEEYASRVVETTASNFIKNAERLTHVYDPANNYFEVFRYIRREDKDAIFESRKERAKEYRGRAEEGFEVLDINQVLIDYYSSLLLVNSHPDRDKIRVKQENGVQKNLKLLIEKKLKNTLLGVTVFSESVKEMGNYYRMNIRATYDGKNISLLYFQYFDGNNVIKGSISDGVGAIDIYRGYYEANTKFDLDLYFGKGKLDKTQLIDEELQSLEDFLYSDNFPNRKKIYKPSKEMQNLVVEAEEFNELALQHPVSKPRKQDINHIMEEIVDAMRVRDYNGVRNYFTDRGFDQFMEIMNYGEVSVFEDEYQIRLVEIGNRTQVRSIPAMFKLKEPGNNKLFSEKLCFLFEDNKICWINFALEDHYIEDAIRRNQYTNDFHERLSGINFMEYYNTIFNLKQIDLINTIFADSAQIFVGYVKESEQLNSSLSNDLNLSLGNKKYEIERYSKSEYIGRLRDHVFPKNKYIHLGFKDMLLRRRSEERAIYAISLHQDYYSSTYSDSGYLMLLIDFENEAEPQIFFRYWQPEKFGEEDLRALTPGDIQF